MFSRLYATLAVLTLVFGLVSLAGTTPVQAKTSLVVNVAGKGQVVIELYTKEAPNTTAQIIRLAESGFYNGQKFFRVLKDPRPYLVMFGDPNSKTMPLDSDEMGKGGSGNTIAYENTGKSNVKGAVGLSTLPRDKNSGDSQFYILLDDKPFLDGNYTVFGQVVQGMEIVESIAVGDQVTSVTVKRG